MSTDFLPVSRKDMEERGIEQLDFVYVIGDAYVDHPSFGHAIISRLLEAHGKSLRRLKPLFLLISKIKPGAKITDTPLDLRPFRKQIDAFFLNFRFSG